MPITALGAAAITAGAQILSSGTNAYAQGRMNKKTREWNEQQYWRTRGDSLRDWAMANEYNSPREQMQRFRDAGLNPNLIYGQMTEAAPTRSSETPAWNPRAPQMDLSANSAIAAYQNTQMQEAQRDLLAEQIRTQQQQQANIAADTANKTQDWTKNKWAADNAAELGTVSLDAAKANLRKTNIETQISLNQDERNAALNASNLREAAERILKIRLDGLKTQAETENQRAEKQRILKSIDDLDKNIELKELDLKLKREGIQPSDPLWLRIIDQQIKKLGKGEIELKSRFPGVFKNFKF